ncbi:MAG: ABC transporter permease [Lachnospiraceae bacterium]|nr:ABC transporter permease [Lachnospiraceae bacterium]
MGNQDEKTTSKVANSILIETAARKRERKQLLIISLVCIFLFFGIWEIAVRLNWIDGKYLCAPSAVIKTFMTKLSDPKPDGAVLGIHIITSLKLVLIGYIAAIIIGVPLGLLMGYYHTFDKLVSPIFEIIRPIPPIAWIPLSIIWLGVGTAAKCFIIFLAAFVPCVINSYTGVKLTPPVLVNVAKTCGATRWEIFSTVCVHYAMPLTFTGIQVSLGNAWSTLVASELVSATAGLGYMIQQGRSLVRPDIILVGMLTIGILGAIFTTLLSKLENKVVKWRAKS